MLFFPPKTNFHSTLSSPFVLQFRSNTVNQLSHLYSIQPSTFLRSQRLNHSKSFLNPKTHWKSSSLLISPPNFCHDPPYQINLLSFKILPKIPSQNAFPQLNFFPAKSVRIPLFDNDPGLDLMYPLYSK